MAEPTSWLFAALAAIASPQPASDPGAGPAEAQMHLLEIGDPATRSAARSDRATKPSPSPAEAGAKTPGSGGLLPFLRLSKAELEESIRCLALNIYHEARAEPEEGKRAVAAVTLNRVADPDFPKSVCGVVQQGGKGRRGKGCQFSWWCDRRSNDPREPGAWSEALALSREALMGKTDDPTHGATYYHATYVKPRWSRTYTKTNRIGRHLFYKPRAA